jgi:hypothetical protein
MLRSDFLIHSEVHRELARTDAVLKKINFGVTQGVVYFNGEFWVRMGVKNLEGQKYLDLLVSTLVGLEKRLKRIPGIRDIFFRFTNVEKYGGFWRRQNVQAKSVPTRHSYTLDEKTSEPDGVSDYDVEERL